MSTIVHSTYVIDKYPTSCKECPFYHETTYKDNAYEGRQGGCLLGYMCHCDMREYDSNTLFDKCDITDDNRVVAVNSCDQSTDNRSTDNYSAQTVCPRCGTSLDKLSVVVSGDVGYLRHVPYLTEQSLYCCPECHTVYSF